MCKDESNFCSKIEQNNKSVGFLGTRARGFCCYIIIHVYTFWGIRYIFMLQEIPLKLERQKVEMQKIESSFEEGLSSKIQDFKSQNIKKEVAIPCWLKPPCKIRHFYPQPKKKLPEGKEEVK